MSITESSPVHLFPNYMQMRPIVPPRVWQWARVFSMATIVTICLLLFVQPKAGLFLFWRIAIPLLPMIFFVAPGLWRNICPLAATNQLPRMLSITRGLSLPKWLREYYYVIGIAMFMVIVASRKVIFNQNGPALGLLLIAVFSTAFVGGMVFKGKSGWCSSICPLLPVQRLYGQTPFATIRNSHCNPCVGCTKNCYDFNPRTAYLADLAEDDPRYSGYRKFFAGAFPGLILAFYTVPDPPAVSVPGLYLRFALYVLAAAGSFFVLDLFLKETPFKLTTVYGALAFNYYYWFTAPAFLGNFLHPVPDPLVWSLRLVVFVLTAVWVSRSYSKEELFVTKAEISRIAGVSVTTSGRPQVTPVANKAQANFVPDAQQGTPMVTFQPGDKHVEVEQNSTLLEVAEAHGLPIEASCRMGVCGADPVCIRHGMQNLSPMTEDERSTIERLGLAASTRLACSARVLGPITVGIKPERLGAESTPATAAPAESANSSFKFDPAVTRVVIIGNGIAGVTTTDYLRRYHPDCEIHLIGREEHHLYNRMAIARLVYGRSAMQGLYLLPDSWYEEHNINTWLNTIVTHIDRDSKVVQLGTGEVLPYDHLVLAMGSTSTIPPIVGFGLPGTFVLRKAADAIELRAYAQKLGASKALVAGGGLLGLEAAYALHKLGLSVGVLERSDRLLRRQLDATGSLLLSSYLQGMGIDIISNAECDAVLGDGRLQRVVLKDGRVLECNILLVAAGITSNMGLAQATGLDVQKGVTVDDRMRTSDPTIWAVGDVAEHRGKIYGLWQAAIDQAKVAAANIAGGEAQYEGTIPVTALKVVGIDIASMGHFEARSGDEIEITLSGPEDHRYRKLVIAEGKLIGAILIGFPRDVPTVSTAVKQHANVAAYLDDLRAGNLEVLSKVTDGQTALVAA